MKSVPQRGSVWLLIGYSDSRSSASHTLPRRGTDFIVAVRIEIAEAVNQ